VTDHKPGPAAIEEAGLAGTEEQRRFRGVLRLACPGHRLPGGVRAGDAIAFPLKPP